MVASPSMEQNEPRRDSVAKGQYPNDNTVDVAVLYERLSHVMAKVDEVSKKIDDNNAARVVSTAHLEDRVTQIETQLTSMRWFLTGLAAGGGVLGGFVASAVTKIIGG